MEFHGARAGRKTRRVTADSVRAFTRHQRDLSKGLCQTACKPGSVPPARGQAAMTIPLDRPLPDGSSSLPEQRRGNSPAGPNPAPVPIWPCSRWGLPCHACYQPRGALLPHPFTLTSRPKTRRRFAFCCTVPGVAPAGRYPAPCFRGARTFLSRGLAAQAAVIRPSDRSSR